MKCALLKLLCHLWLNFPVLPAKVQTAVCWQRNNWVLGPSASKHPLSALNLLILMAQLEFEIGRLGDFGFEIETWQSVIIRDYPFAEVCLG